jgi:hypothetical protein
MDKIKCFDGLIKFAPICVCNQNMIGDQIGEEVAKILCEGEQFVLLWFLDGLDINH